MTTLASHHGSPLAVEWQPDAIRLLDEHHLIAISDCPVRRAAFAASLARSLREMRDTEVCNLNGRAVSNIDSFCTQLQRALPARSFEPIE